MLVKLSLLRMLVFDGGTYDVHQRAQWRVGIRLLDIAIRESLLLSRESHVVQVAADNRADSSYFLYDVSEVVDEK